MKTTVKKYKDFIKEELNPLTYKMAADKLDAEYHGERKEKLMKYFEEKFDKIPPFNIMKISGRGNNKVFDLYSDLKIGEMEFGVGEEYYDDEYDDYSIDGIKSDITFRNGNRELFVTVKLKWNNELSADGNNGVGYDEEGEHETYRIFFENRKEATRFFKLFREFFKIIVKSGQFDYKKSKKLDFSNLKININKYFMDSKVWDDLVEQQTDVQDEELADWEPIKPEVNVPDNEGEFEEESDGGVGSASGSDYYDKDVRYKTVRGNEDRANDLSGRKKKRKNWLW